MNEFNGCIALLVFLLSAVFTSNGANVKDFGAKGDGITDDTQSIIMAVANADDGVVYFPLGKYRITESIEIILSTRGRIGLTGAGGTSTIIMEGSGPAFKITGTHKGTSNPQSIKDEVWQAERMPVISELEITGNNPDAVGIELSYTLKTVVKSVLIRNVKYGILLSERNRNVLIESSHIFNCHRAGIFLDHVNIHQININNCHISYNKEAGIKVTGSEIRNFQITGNDIEYNCSEEFAVSADIWVDTSEKGSSVREASITGNTIQAVPTPGGRNILFNGSHENMNKIGLWSITGNHISNHTVNIHLKNVRGVSVSGNTFIRGYERNIITENCVNIVIGSNVFDHNDDYYPPQIEVKDGILMRKMQNTILADNIMQGSKNEGALELYDCGEISVSGCHITDFLKHGIKVDNCNGVNINGCFIRSGKRDDNSLISAGIYFTGDCSNISVYNNILDTGFKRGIINDSQNRISVKSNINIHNKLK